MYLQAPKKKSSWSLKKSMWTGGFFIVLAFFIFVLPKLGKSEPAYMPWLAAAFAAIGLGFIITTAWKSLKLKDLGFELEDTKSSNSTIKRYIGYILGSPKDLEETEKKLPSQSLGDLPSEAVKKDTSIDVFAAVLGSVNFLSESLLKAALTAISCLKPAHLRYLLEQKLIEANIEIGGESFLHIVVRMTSTLMHFNKIAICKLLTVLVKNGSDRASTDKNGQTPFELFAKQPCRATTNGDVLAIAKLLDPCTPIAEISDDDEHKPGTFKKTD